MSRRIKEIIIHCSDTPNGKAFPVKEIDAWHKARHFKRMDDMRRKFNPSLESIGYHYVIMPDGAVASGRSTEEIGAHAEGHNAFSIGICLEGRDKFSTSQWIALKTLVNGLCDEYPEARIIGHYEVNTHGKTCPNFNVQEWVRRGIPDIAHIL